MGACKGRIPGTRANRTEQAVGHLDSLVHSPAVAEQATMQAMEGLLHLVCALPAELRTECSFAPFQILAP